MRAAVKPFRWSHPVHTRYGLTLANQKGPVARPGLSYSAMPRTLRRFVRHLFLGRLVGGLRTAARALGERRLDLLHGLGLGAAVAVDTVPCSSSTTSAP